MAIEAARQRRDEEPLENDLKWSLLEPRTPSQLLPQIKHRPYRFYERILRRMAGVTLPGVVWTIPGQRWSESSNLN